MATLSVPLIISLCIGLVQIFAIILYLCYNLITNLQLNLIFTIMPANLETILILISRGKQ